MSRRTPGIGEGAVGRADLERAVSVLGEASAATLAPLFGLQLRPPDPEKREEKNKEDPDDPGEGVRTSAAPSTWPTNRTPLPQWVPLRWEPPEAPPPPVQTRTAPYTVHRAEMEGRGIRLVPAVPPAGDLLTLAEGLGEYLLHPESGRQGRFGVDLSEAVGRLARREVLSRLPRPPAATLGGQVRVLFDGTPALRVVRPDIGVVLRRLVEIQAEFRWSLAVLADEVLGVDGVVTVRRLQRALSEARPWNPTEAEVGPLAAGDTVVACTDLGWAEAARLTGAETGSDATTFAFSRTMRVWQRLGEELNGRGIRTIAVLPLPPDLLPPTLRAAWECVAIDPRERPLDPVARAKAEEDVLRLCSAAGLGCVGLLRAFRQILPAATHGLSLELTLPHHPKIAAWDGSGFVLEAQVARTLRTELLTEPTHRRQAVARTLSRWRTQTPPELFDAEVLAWHLSQTTTPEAPPANAQVDGGPAYVPMGDLHAARTRLDGVLSTLREGGPSAPGWAAWGRVCLGSLPDPAYGTKGWEHLAELHTLCFAGFSDIPVPPGVRAPTAEGSVTPIAIRQVGAHLHLSRAPERPDPYVEPLTPGSPVARIPAGTHLFVEVSGAKTQLDVRTILASGQTVSLPKEGQVYFEGGAGRLMLSPTVGPLPLGVVGRGRDRYGLFEDWKVNGVGFRMRWIPPGSFLQGSPEDEPGRSVYEGPQRMVHLREGYWLGETPVTQALWKVVMGDNPRGFVDPERPVEQVDWAQATTFCSKLRSGESHLVWRLPTEAEWERACRADTEGPSWRGDIGIVGENNAPGLDAIAWYGGNSGVNWDLGDKGYDSSYWPEVQHPNPRAGTRRVKAKAANPLGLYDMLGNVWEWCVDRTDGGGSYAPGPQVDPVSFAGPRRRIRGGSWAHVAQVVRAAYRLWREPGTRSDYLGFRLARAPALPQAPNQKGQVADE